MYDTVAACRSKATDKKSCDTVIHTALAKLVRDSLNVSGKTVLNVALVYGEGADDEHLTSVLRQAFENIFTNGGSIPLSRVKSFSPDLAFAGSRAMAVADLVEKNHRLSQDQGKDITKDEL